MQYERLICNTPFPIYVLRYVFYFFDRIFKFIFQYLFSFVITYVVAWYQIQILRLRVNPTLNQGPDSSIDRLDLFGSC